MTWPPMFARVLARHGPARVWRVGLQALGFPPTWCETGREMKTLYDALKLTADVA